MCVPLRSLIRCLKILENVTPVAETDKKQMRLGERTPNYFVCAHIRSLMKLFNADNMDIIRNCQRYFADELLSIVWHI